MDSLFGDGPDGDADSYIPASATESSRELTTIASDGTVILEVHADENSTETVLFRVSVQQLRHASKYFDRLFDPSKFQEGMQVQKQLDQLRITDGNGRTSSTTEQLPRVKIVGIGEVTNVKSIKPLMSDFLNLLHRRQVFGARSSPPLLNLANLTIVADRFDACESLLRELRRQGALKEPSTQRDQEGTTRKRAEQLRQRIYVGLTLGHEKWTRRFTGELIISGDCTATEKLSSPTASSPWWDLPQGLEDEMVVRRKAILSTLQSLMDYFIERFTSRTQQCRLGYDSSPQCDSFQAGEFVKFLIRTGGLPFLKNCTRYQGNISNLLKQLKGSQEYQVNQFHSHCGPKKNFNTGLLFIDRYINTEFVGFSPGCCLAHKNWSSEKKALMWSEVPTLPPRNFGMEFDGSCMYRGMHERVRLFFMASERDWSFLKHHTVHHDPDS